MSDNWHRPKPYPAPSWMTAIDEAPPPGTRAPEPKPRLLSELWGWLALGVLLVVLGTATRVMAALHWIGRKLASITR